MPDDKKYFDALKELYEGLNSAFDFVLADSPAGIGDNFRLAVSASDEALLVTTAHLPSLRDADNTAAMLRGSGLKEINLVVNKVRGDLIAGGLSLSPEDVAETLRLPLLGAIPDDDEIFLRDAGKLPPDAKSGGSFKMLAGNLLTGKRKVCDFSRAYRGFSGYIKRKIKNGL